MSKNIEINCKNHFNSQEDLSESVLNNYYYQYNKSRHKRKALEWVLGGGQK